MADDLHELPGLLPALSAFTGNEDFFEMLLWGGGVLFLVLLLFIVMRFLKVGISAKLRNEATPFGMGLGDVNNMYKEGQLTEDELKLVREAMARQIVERTKAEQEKRSLPASAATALALAEEKLVAKKLVAGEHGAAPPKPAPAAAAPAPPPAEPEIVSTAPRVAEHLRALLGKTDLELDELCEAGFVTHEDIDAVRSAREQGA